MTAIEIVRRERARLRLVEVLAAISLSLVVTLAVAVAGAWLLGQSRWITLPRATPLLVWVALLVGNAAVVWWVARYIRRGLGSTSVAAAIEREQALRAGSLRGLLELTQENAIARRADRLVTAGLDDRSATLAPALYGMGRRRAIRAFAVAAVTMALLLWAAPTLQDGLLAIRRPIAAWKGTLVPDIAFRGLPTELMRGESLRISIEAAGRRRVELSSRATGEGWRTVTIAVDSASGVAATMIGPVRGDVVLVASDGRRATDTVVVRVTDRPFVGGVVLRAIYPAYLGRSPEGLPVGEPARVPRGTLIEISGRASTALKSVYLRGDLDSVKLDASGHGFSGQLRPARSGRWSWSASASRHGVAIADVPLPLEIEVVPDSAPVVELVSPSIDTLVATTDRVTLQVTASDDHGIAAIEMHSTAERRGRERRTEPVAQRLAEGQGNLWHGQPTVDLATRGLEPGDALRLTIVAVDNSPWAQRGASRELVLRIPTMEERRSLVRSAADSAAAEAQSAAAAQKSLEQRTDQASRERGNRDRNSSGAQGAEGARQRERDMSFESAEKARALAQEQRELAERVDRLREAAEQLEEQLRQASALDSSLARQLREAQDLLRDALTQDLLEQMRKLEDAARDLSGDQARDALKNLAEMQRRLREQLEKSAEMLKRAALEGAMETLKDEASEIAEKQRALADSAAKSRPSRENQGHGERQNSRELTDRSQQLATDVQQLQERLEKEQADAAAGKAQSAEQNASASAQRMRQQNARDAAAKMEQAAQDLAAAREQQVDEWKKELTDALDESIQELLQMAREESELEQRARSAGGGRDNNQMEQIRGQQSAVQEGVDKTGERLQKEGRKTSLLSGRSQRAMNEAKQRVSQATQQLSEPRGGQQAATNLGEAAEALNRAAASLARDRERANSATSATGFAEMLQQLQEMAKRQGSINAQAQGLIPMPGQGAMSPEAQATARMLARQQRGIAQQLEEMGDASGGDRAAELAREARQLADALEQTRVDATTLARQQQLFRRLLDAGRSLEKEEREDSEKREARAATGDDRFDPGRGDARGREASRYREPTWEDLRGLSADERRAIMEYFKRINAERP